MKLNLYSKIIFVALLAFTVNSFVYLSFGNIYSSKILNYNDFEQQFSSGIYQYRMLSGYFLIWIYEFLSALNVDYSIFKLKFFDPGADEKMFLSFYLLNTFFLVLSSAVMVLILESKNFVSTSSEKLLIIAVSVFVIAISQFVIVPYDVSSYFFLLLFFFFLNRYSQKNSTQNLVILVLVMLVSTLNRESSALSLALAATLLYSKFGFKKEMLLPIAVLALTFLAVYFGMRLINASFSTNDGNLLVQNLSQPKNGLGLLFWMVFFVFTVLLAKDRMAVRHILLFHLFSTPYIFMCLYTGIIYEIRLYVPLFLTSIFLGRVQLTKIE